MTSPSCDCAYSVMPTVAVSPSFLTHSWVSANRIPLRSAISSPFPLFRMRPLVEGQRNHLRPGGCAPNVDAKMGPRLRQGRRHVGHPDVVAEGEGDIPRGHGTDPLAVGLDHVAVAGDTALPPLRTHH